MAITNITALPTPPTRDDPTNFASRADAFLAALPNFATQVNTAGDQIELAETAAKASADAALISENNAALSSDVAMDLANFYGNWAALTGALNVPASVTHSSKIWFLLTNLANVTASEPTATSTDWAEFETDYAYLSADQVFSGVSTFTQTIEGKTNSQVLRSGDTMTGPLSVPAGATGAQVPQAQEIGTLANAQLTTHYKRSNILGTVSQSSGVPTGAIIEKGSNANGSYVRFADGTQMCWHGVATVSGGTTWTYPAAFTGSVIAVASEPDTASPRFFLVNPSATSASLRAFNADTNVFSNANARVIAIGRWF